MICTTKQPRYEFDVVKVSQKAKNHIVYNVHPRGEGEGAVASDEEADEEAEEEAEEDVENEYDEANGEELRC